MLEAVGAMRGNANALDEAAETDSEALLAAEPIHASVSGG